LGKRAQRVPIGLEHIAQRRWRIQRFDLARRRAVARQHVAEAALQFSAIDLTVLILGHQQAFFGEVALYGGVDRPQGSEKALLLDGRRIDDRFGLRPALYRNKSNTTRNRDHGERDAC
jgi:hypothetical protein